MTDFTPVTTLQAWLRNDDDDLSLDLENLKDCDNTTCMQLGRQDVNDEAIVLATVIDPFITLPVIIVGNNLRVESDKNSCNIMPLAVMIHNSSGGNVGQGRTSLLAIPNLPYSHHLMFT